MTRVTGRMQLWIDETPRDGPENMAIDEWLLRICDTPVLRAYRWLPGWGSFGYFVTLGEARAALPGLRLVRRWTGGGIVDHRSDWTYTLALPAHEPLAVARGGESYRVIHRALAAALSDAGIEVSLAGDLGPVRGGECFRQPTTFDLIDRRGVKIAGAGQRRTAGGLLHQGSLALDAPSDLARRLAGQLASEVVARDVAAEPGGIECLLRRRYCSRAWLTRR